MTRTCLPKQRRRMRTSGGRDRAFTGAAVALGSRSAAGNGLAWQRNPVKQGMREARLKRRTELAQGAAVGRLSDGSDSVSGASVAPRRC